jgi:leader peptidase (prepilin peptidase)/N-methyltransferase
MPMLLDFPWPVLAAPFVGSFLATLAVRLPEGRGWVGGRSACPACGAALAWHDLVPVASWLVRRGRCRSCAAPIAPLYPLIELAALVAALWAWTLRPGPEAWIDAGLGWTLIALAACDARARVLPDTLVLPLGVAGLALAWPGGALLDHGIGALAGFLAFAAVRWTYHRLRGREGLGLGDVKLMAAIGALVSWQGLPSVVTLAAAGGLVALGLARAQGRPVDRRTEVPFGPFLAFATWLVWLYGPLAALAVVD